MVDNTDNAARQALLDGMTEFNCATDESGDFKKEDLMRVLAHHRTLCLQLEANNEQLRADLEQTQRASQGSIQQLLAAQRALDDAQNQRNIDVRNIQQLQNLLQQQQPQN